MQKTHVLSLATFSKNSARATHGSTASGTARRRKAALYALLLITAALFACGKEGPFEGYFPETGKAAIQLHANDLRSHLNILYLALAPGYEDLPALAYFRLAKGAEVSCAFVTNGEAGESDVETLYPNQLLGVRREEAFHALRMLDVDEYFINMPDIAAASSVSAVRKHWPAKVLQKELAKLIAEKKPDIILIGRDWQAPGESLRSRVLAKDVRAAVVALEPGQRTGSDSTGVQASWPVNRVFIDRGDGSGRRVPVEQKDALWKKTYREIAAEAAETYASLRLQRQKWAGGKAPAYTLLYPEDEKELRAIDAGLPESISTRLQSLNAGVQKLTALALNGRNDAFLEQSVSLLDSISMQIVLGKKLRAQDKRVLYKWKEKLDEMRCAALGIKVHYTISDTALTELQLTYLTITQVDGLADAGEARIFFDALGDGWAINENIEKRLPLVYNEPYRLVTPKNLEFNTPVSLFGLQSHTYKRQIPFFIVRQTQKPRKLDFIHKSAFYLSAVPRFLVDVQTPIVRMIPGERVDVRLTNYSRDGVADTLRIEHLYATAARSFFRLSNKDDTHLARLYPIWRGNPPEGSYLIPITIRGEKVGNFLARKFTAVVDRRKKVGVLTGLPNSALASALRRLQVAFTEVTCGENIAQQIDTLDVLLIDRRALTLRPEILERREQLLRFVENGGHLIVLAQEPEAWRASALFPGCELRETDRFDNELPVQFDHGHPLVIAPNELTQADWQNWILRRAYQEIVLGNGVQAEKLVLAADSGSPLLISAERRLGRLTYIGLALTPQLLNVQPGAYRLLANLISNQSLPEGSK